MSPYTQATEAARERATQLGHRLPARWDVIRTSAYASCTACGAGVSVLFYGDVSVLGNAVEMPCRDGEANVAPAPAPAPPTGKAKRAPKPAPATVDASDVPWPSEQLAPARDAMVTR